MTALTRDVLTTLYNTPDVAFPHQGALHLDLYGRQRRLVAAQPNWMGRFLYPMTFFYTSRLLDFWSNVTWDDLHAQSLYRAYAVDRFPSIFNEPPKKLPERLWGAASNLVGKYSPSLRARMRPPEINRHTIVKANRANIENLLHEVGPLLGDIIDVAAVRRELHRYPQSEELNSVQIVRLVNLLMLIRLAHANGTQS
jgi:hypothetical protein